MDDNGNNEEESVNSDDYDSVNDPPLIPASFVYRNEEDLSHLDKGSTTCVVFARGIQVVPMAAFGGCHWLSQVSFPSGLERIDSLAFDSCFSLERVSFPSSLLVIGSYSFADCRSLKHIELNDGLRTIGERAFFMCRVERIVIPSSVKAIGTGAFMMCSRLEFVDFGEGVETIGESAFGCCSRMAIVRLPPRIRSIEHSTFATCRSLLSVELPLGLQYIRQGAFSRCLGLKNFAIPSSVEENGEEAFDECPWVSKVLYPKNWVPFQEETMFPDGFHSKPREERASLLHQTYVKRFYGYPLHEACYKQSYLPHMVAVESIQAVLAVVPDSIDQVDGFGMSAFHILALSSKPRISLFQMLHALCPRKLLDTQDGTACHPIDYVCANTSITYAERRMLIEFLAQVTIMERISKLGLSVWRSRVMAGVRDQLLCDSSDEISVAEVYRILEHYEQRENLSLLELKIWHWKLGDQEVAVKETVATSRERKKPKFDYRQVARVNCGANTIISNMVPFYGMEKLDD